MMLKTAKGSPLAKDKLPTAAASRSAPRKQRAAPVKRTRRSADDILNRIVQAAAEEFRRRGFTGATTAAIARRAEVTEAQLFRYFGSKSNLFRETIFKPLDQHFLGFVGKHALGARGAGASRRMANLYTTELQGFIRENSSMLRSVIAQMYESGSPQGLAEIKSLGAFFDHGAAIRAKRTKGKPKTDPRLTVRISFVTVLACVLFRDWIFPSGLASDKDIEAAINTFVIEAIDVDPDGA
jgi:AcrR family transcriptional regulator